MRRNEQPILTGVLLRSPQALVALDIRKSSTFSLFGVLAVAVATVAWGADNALTRRLAENDPLEIVAAKGGLGATATGLLAFGTGEVTPSSFHFVMLVLCGATGYGFSLRLYLLAQRHIGAARTGSVFAVGPFLGAAVAWAIGDRNAGLGTALGTVAFIVGVWLHLSEQHEHKHIHRSIEHEHAHKHDDGHHNPAHEPVVDGEHTHWHRHESLEHEHSHAPDLHHGHVHT